MEELGEIPSRYERGSSSYSFESSEVQASTSANSLPDSDPEDVQNFHKCLISLYFVHLKGIPH